MYRYRCSSFKNCPDKIASFLKDQKIIECTATKYDNIYYGLLIANYNGKAVIKYDNYGGGIALFDYNEVEILLRYKYSGTLVTLERILEIIKDYNLCFDDDKNLVYKNDENNILITNDIYPVLLLNAGKYVSDKPIDKLFFETINLE